MKVFIRDIITRNYLFSAGSWTDKKCDALNFEKPENAFQFCKRLEVQDVEVVVKRQDKEQVFNLPSDVDEAPSRTTRPIK